MAYLGLCNIDDLVTFTCNTHSASTGAATDADSDPAYRIYEDETGTPILTGVMSKLDDANTTGFYSEQITLSAANGFENGKSYNIYIAAAVSAITGTMNHNFQVKAIESNISSIKTQTDKLSFDSDNYILSDLKAIEGALTNGNNATLKLKNLNILNSAAGGDAINLESGSGGIGINIVGHAYGAFITADGVDADGIYVQSTGGGKSIDAPNDITVSDGDLTLANIASAVWSNVTRTLTSISDSAGVTTLLTRIASALNITSGKVESNIKQINGTNVTGDGSGTPWGPA